MVLASLLSACASYTPQPLVTQASLHTALPALPSLPAQGVAPPFVAPHPFDARDGLDATEVATLAVLLSPEVKSARAAPGIGGTGASPFAAGLLARPAGGADARLPVRRRAGPDRKRLQPGAGV